MCACTYARMLGGSAVLSSSAVLTPAEARLQINQLKFDPPAAASRFCLLLYRAPGLRGTAPRPYGARAQPVRVLRTVHVHGAPPVLIVLCRCAIAVRSTVTCCAIWIFIAAAGLFGVLGVTLKPHRDQTDQGTAIQQVPFIKTEPVVRNRCPGLAVY